MTRSTQGPSTVVSTSRSDKFDEEGDSSREVVEHNADVDHPPDRHVPEHSSLSFDERRPGGREAKRVFEATMPMKKIDIVTIEAVRRG